MYIILNNVFFIYIDYNVYSNICIRLIHSSYFNNVINFLFYFIFFIIINIKLHLNSVNILFVHFF